MFVVSGSILGRPLAPIHALIRSLEPAPIMEIGSKMRIGRHASTITASHVLSAGKKILLRFTTSTAIIRTIVKKI